MKATGGNGIIKAIDCVAGRTGATLVRQLALNGCLLVYGALSSHRQTDAAAFEMPVFAPALVYSAAEVRGWFIFSWLARKGMMEGSQTLRSLLDRMADGTLEPPAAQRYSFDRAHEAFAAAESAAHGTKPLLAFTEQ
jgi:NADPH2:quinone reductase